MARKKIIKFELGLSSTQINQTAQARVRIELKLNGKGEKKKTPNIKRKGEKKERIKVLCVFPCFLKSQIARKRKNYKTMDLDLGF